jgi:hypothetical protein
MFPIDNEFLFLYFFYFLIGVILTFGTFFSIRHKHLYKINFFVFLIYSIFFVFLFSDKSNFEGGRSLAVIFYSGLIVFLHVLILILFWIYNSFFTQNK